jgi:peptidoglycan/LPS O-acetylase OafA/YrhL
MTYRREIDGLRAVAVLPVLFFHAGFTWFPGGFIGVDVFFVISGYLITGNILSDLRAGRFSLWDFYERRFRRIAPALLAMCAATIPFAWQWMVPAEFEAYGRSLLATALSFSNIHFWKATGYFAQPAALQPLLHTWSLAVEEQFYVLFPLLLIALKKYRAAGIAALAIASFLLTRVMAESDPAGNFYLLPTRFWELAAGALLAVFAPATPSRAVAEPLAAGGLACVVLSIFLLDDARSFPGPWALPPVLGTLALLAAGGDNLTARCVLARRPLVAIGLISYSLYLWHQPLFAFARIRLFGDVSKPLYLVLIGASVILAYASWRWIEQPFRDRRRFSRTSIFAGTAAAAAALFVFGLVSDRTGGLPQRQPSIGSAFGERLRVNHGLSADCEGKVPPPRTCVTDDAPEIVVWGDSFAMHLVAGIVASRPSVRLAQVTKSACGPLLGVAPLILPDYPRSWAEKCLAFNEAAKGYIERTKSIRFAVLSSPVAQYMQPVGTLLAGETVIPSGMEPARLHLLATVAWLKARGIAPVIFAPPPSSGSDTGACLARSAWIGEAGDRCSFPAADAAARGKKVRALLYSLGVPVVDVADFLCDERRCRARDGDVLIYRNGTHLSYEGSRYVGRQMDFFGRIVHAAAPAPAPGAQAGTGRFTPP